MVALTIASGDAFGPHPGGLESSLGRIHHRIQPHKIARFALDGDPAIYPGQQFLGVRCAHYSPPAMSITILPIARPLS